MNAPDNLEEFSDPPNYDIEEGERSAPRIAFYCDLAKTVGGPVLEVACGSGLVTIPIAAQGLPLYPSRGTGSAPALQRLSSDSTIWKLG